MLYKLLACNWDKNQSVMGFNCCSLHHLYLRCIDLRSVPLPGGNLPKRV